MSHGRIPETSLAGRTASGDVLVRCEHVSKKFCKTLKRSLWYGLRDTVSELNPFSSAMRLAEHRILAPPDDTDLRRDEFWALRDLSLEVRRGECLGLIGHNGAGKSTLLKLLNGTIRPDRGRIRIRGRMGALIELGAGFNPILTGRENIYSRGALLGFSKREIDSRFDAIVDFAEMEDFIDMPVQNYSSGMSVRLGFAVSAQMEPDVLVVDEVLAVGDLGFRMKCYNAIGRLLQNAAVIFVSHSMPQIARISTAVACMQRGVCVLQTTDISAGIRRYYEEFGSIRASTTGSGKVSIVNVRYPDMPETDVAGWCCRAESAFGFTFDILNPHGLPDVELKMEVWDQEARPAMELVAEPEMRVVHLKPGANTLCVSVPRLWLTSGRYTLTLHAIDPATGEVLCRAGDIAGFVVTGPVCCGADAFCRYEVCLS